jgi:hypothetical protein
MKIYVIMDKLLRSYFIKNSTILLIIFVLFQILLISCSKNETNENLECHPNQNMALNGIWSNPTFYFNPSDNCVDTICIQFELHLKDDLQYELSYLLFDSRNNPLELFQILENGEFKFNCIESGVETRGTAYNYVDGKLILEPISGNDKILKVRKDGLFGLHIWTGDLGLEFNREILLQEQ